MYKLKTFLKILNIKYFYIFYQNLKHILDKFNN